MFGKRLREARNAKGYTLEQLADIYNETFDGGLNKGTLSKYENGKQIPMITVARDLSKVLNVSTDYLLGKPVFYTSNFDLGDEISRDSKNLIYILDNLATERREVIEDLIIATWKRQNKSK